jgi:hypothetical protein
MGGIIMGLVTSVFSRTLGTAIFGVGRGVVSSVADGVAKEVIADALSSNSVQHPAAAATVATQAIAESPNLAIVPVKSAWFSKVNWVAGGLLIVNMFSFFGHPLPDDYADIVTKIFADFSPLLIIVLRTWFTRKVTDASV